MCISNCLTRCGRIRHGLLLIVFLSLTFTVFLHFQMKYICEVHLFFQQTVCGIGTEELVLVSCEFKLNFLLLSANKSRGTFWYLSQLSLSDK